MSARAALITGGTSGIGKATAEVLHSRGYGSRSLDNVWKASPRRARSYPRTSWCCVLTRARLLTLTGWCRSPRTIRDSDNAVPERRRQTSRGAGRLR
jgi:hypothetical protein